MRISYFPPVLFITFAVIFQTCLLGPNLLTLLLLFAFQILSPVVETIPSYYSIRLAAAASRKEYIDLEKWLTNNLTTYKDVFFEVMFPPLLA